MLGVTDHLRNSASVDMDLTGTRVHADNASLVQPVYYILRWHSHSADEELGLFLDNHGNQIVEKPLGVVVIGLSSGRR